MKNNHKLSFSFSEEADTRGHSPTWNTSVRFVTLLYHWGIVHDYPHLIELIALHQNWCKQSKFKDDSRLLEQLVKQWPPVDKKPRIWACFHIGLYGLIPRAILLRDRGVAILLKDEVFEEQQDMYLLYFQKTFGRQPADSELRFIRSGEPDCLTQLKRSVTDGLDVICFVDGKEGSTASKGWTVVNLHDMPIPVRYGIAVLSRWTGATVQPIVFSQVQGVPKVRSRWDFHPVTTNQYRSLMQYCYDLLHDLTAEEWIQWEFAPSFFDSVMANSKKKQNVTAKEQAWWIPMMTPKEYLLVDVRSGQTVVVSEAEHQYLCHKIQRLVVKIQ